MGGSTRDPIAHLRPTWPDPAALDRAAELIVAIDADLEGGGDAAAPLAELSAAARRPVGAAEVRGFWRSMEADELARHLLARGLDRRLTREETVAVVAYTQGPDGDDVAYWAELLERQIPGFFPLVVALAPGFSPEEVVDLAEKRARGEPVPLEEDGPTLCRIVPGLRAMPLVAWLSDPEAQRPAPGLPATMRRKAQGLAADAGPEGVLAHLAAAGLPAAALDLVRTRIRYWEVGHRWS